MIITQTPYRISLFGGGTDYPDWYLRYGGQVLSTTIDKYVYISCRYLPPFFDHKLRLVYSQVEACKTANQLEHPAAREILKHFNISDGLEIHYDGDLPSRSGVGSSSAFSVGLISALHRLNNYRISAEQLATEAIYVEQKLIGESVGSQDQVNAAHGGFNSISFRQDGSIEVTPIRASEERKGLLNSRLMLFYTGIMRTAETISVTYATDTQRNAEHLKRMQTIATEAQCVIEGNASIDNIGELLHESWLEKQKLSDIISNRRVDLIYRSAKEAGALGGKLCGAGGGGMILLYVPQEKQADVRNALSSLLYVPFKFSADGCKVIFANKQERYQNIQSNKFSGIEEFIELSDLD